MNVLNLSKIGVNALEATDPNDFIFSTQWNTPKIVKQDSDTPILGTAASETFRNVAHGLNYTPFIFGFVKFADNRVASVGSKAAGVNFHFTNMRVNATNVRFGYLNNTGGNYSPTFKYLATEIPLVGTPSVANMSGNRIVLSKTGVNALTDTNPNNKIYDSQFPTLKYYSQATSTINIPAASPSAGQTVVAEIALTTHNLGYYPFFGSHYEFSGDDPGKYYVVPSMFADSGFWNYNMVYTTSTQLIFRREFGNNFGISYTAQTIKIYWKIYSFDLDL